MPITADSDLRNCLAQTRLIAMPGASDNPERPSYGVFRYLRAAGYEVIPVNPGRVGRDLDGVPFVARLSDIERPIDMVDVFRASDALPSLVEEILALKTHPRFLWTQLGVVHPQAIATAEAAGLQVIVDRCTKIEHRRLGL
ncbi:MAG: CoA-binding protein [Proteobacteria bacterium]|nr:CoA-binding protein [Pseudomonadota bacterium]